MLEQEKLQLEATQKAVEITELVSTKDATSRSLLPTSIQPLEDTPTTIPLGATPSFVPTVKPSLTPTTELSLQEPSIRNGEESNLWISCDSNMDIEGRNFTWIGPDAGSCNISLLQNEFVVGAADRFQEFINAPPEETRCVAFLLHGPLNITISMKVAGGGNFHSAADLYNISYFEEKWIELDHHQTCNFNERGYDKITCTQDGCSQE
ncbi:MAG: hypothetical protein GY796_19300 [Chloroflexi bacterium]|nr:hypothetical protein [Chloroflexota bacterium]